MTSRRPTRFRIAIAIALASFALLHPYSARATRADYPTGAGPTGCAVADFDGDGKLDVVTANAQAGTVSVLRGTTGGLLPKVDYATGAGPAAVLAIDLDQDGFPDLVVANSWGRTVSVLRNLGNGTFAAKVDIDMGGAPNTLVAGDWDLDGHVDVASTIPTRNSVTLLFGDGAGGLGRRRIVAAYGLALNGLAAGDLDGDGNLDLVITDGGPNVLNVMAGDGHGGFELASTYPTGTSPQGVVLADVNGDGRLDAVVATAARDSVSFLAGDGTGGFLAPRNSPIGPGPVQVVVADLDQDGKLDVAASNPGTASMTVAFGDGTGRFLYPNSAGCGAGPWGIATGSFDGLSGPVVVTANTSANSVTLLSQVFGRAASVTLVVTPNPADPTTIVRLRAVVEPANATGTITFRESTVLLGTYVLSGGVAARSATFAPGSHTLVAEYSGDGQFPPTTSAPVTLVVTAGLPTTTTLVVASSSRDYGASATCTATVTPAAAHGSATITDGSTVLGTVPLSLGRGVLSIPAGRLDAGTHRLVASYTGDGLYMPSSSDSIPLVLLPDSTRTTLSPPAPTLPYSATRTFTVTVSNLSLPAQAPAGIVHLQLDGGATSYSAPLANGVVQFADFPLSIGTHSLRAVFETSQNFTGSASAPVTQQIVPDSTATTLVVYPLIARLGEARTFVGTAVPRVPGMPNATFDGSIQFVVDGADWGAPQPVVNHEGRIVGGEDLDIGAHVVGVRYLGSGTAYPSASTNASITVAPGLTRTSIVGTPSPTAETTPKTFTATVEAEGPAHFALTGDVQFQLDGAPLGSPVALASGVATLAGVRTIPTGLHLIRAAYLGSPRYVGSASGALMHRVVPTSLPSIVSVLDLPADQGRQVRLTVRASALDVPGSATPVVGYGIYRRVDPGAAPARVQPAEVALAGWDQVGSFDARAETLYTAVVPTMRDSNDAGTHWATYMVSARTNTPSVYFDSAPDSGYSVDNYPPASPAPFSARIESGVAHLHWGANREPDFALYRLYRGTGAHVTPSAATLVAQQPDTGFVDPSPGEGAAYALTAVDQNGNESEAAQLGASEIPVTSSPLALAVALHGSNPATGASLVVDVTLAGAAPARVELFEVSGRRVLVRDLGALPAGRHAVELAGRDLRAGLYFVQLTQGAERRRERICVIR